MTVFSPRTGKWLPLPWNDNFDKFLGLMSDKTYDYTGDELLHQIHIEVIETKLMVIRFYGRLRLMLGAGIGLLVLLALLHG
jgi:hypothetical protein